MSAGRAGGARWLAVAGLAATVTACSPLAPSRGDWQHGPSRPALFPVIRATVLADGRVLAASSADQPLGASSSRVALVQLYDPSTNRWSAAADYPAGWAPGASVRLRDGSVLFAPGRPGGQPLRYVPQTDRWVTGGRTPINSVPDRTILLGDGRVLALGGFSYPAGVPADTSQIYDPATATWTVGAPMRESRAGLAAVLLLDGSVLVVGGNDVSQTPVALVERYDPAHDRWSAASSELLATFLQQAVGLADGRVLVVNFLDQSGRLTADDQIYDPRSNSWLFGPRQPSLGGGPVVDLPDGRVLMVKTTLNPTTPLFRGEILDPSTMTWSVTRTLPGEPRAVVRLRDGRVMAIGQQADWIFDPNTVPPPEPGQQGIGSPQLSELLGAVAALLALLVLGQYLVTRAADRRRLRPVS